MSQVCTVKIAGPAGTGIKSSGLLLSQILLHHGFNIRDYSEYPSLVRGGHNTYQVSFSLGEIFAPHQKIDLFFALQPHHWQQHQQEFDQKSLVFAPDSTLTLPLGELATQIGGPLYINTLCLGVAAYVLNLDQKTCLKIINHQFGSGSPNLKAFKTGFTYASQNFSGQKLLTCKSKIIRPKSCIYDGNESFAWGFIQGGGSFYAAYPMTPASGVLHFLAAKQSEYNLKVIHPEDEIAAASLAAGAAFVDGRSATGTSGGGFALMTETVSFCGVANLGVVFYLASRPGPATGLPTWTSQGDLLFAVHSGHGEFSKIVLAPGDQAESFSLSGTALNLAAQFNVPVIVLSDKFISESSASLPDLSKAKLKIIKSTLGLRFANSYEHDDQGFSIEDAALVKTQVEKRLSLTSKILKVVPKPTFYFGSKNSKTLVVSWGSVKSSIQEALKIKNDPDVAHVHFRTLWPLDQKIEHLFKSFKKIIVVENNATSQLTTLLKSQFNFKPDKIILKYDGRPFFPEELIEKLWT